MLDPSTTPRLIGSLAEVSAACPQMPKLLVTRVQRTGHELLGTAAERGVATEDWEPTTPRNLAYKLVAADLGRAALSPADDLDEAGLLDVALDAALADLGDPRFSALAEGPGFRTAAHEAVRTLRLAGVDADALASVPLGDPVRHRLLVRTLAEYEAGLRNARLADLADVFRRAATAVISGQLPASTQLHLVAGLRRRGWAGRFVATLAASGAEILAGDPTLGLEPGGYQVWRAGDPVHPLSWLHAPQKGAAVGTPDLFAAASPRDELREVLRRVVTLGLSWDQVEIVGVDPSYAALLDGSVRRLGIPVRYAAGLPAARTPAGRAVTEHLAGPAMRALGGRCSEAAVAAHAAEFLFALPADPARDRLLHRAERIAATLHRRTTAAAAVRSVQGRLGLHVPLAAEEDDAAAGEGGGLLFSELQHGGRSGRPATFVVGLSAEVFPGAGIQDPLLPDEDRARIGAALPDAADGLPSVAERLRERRHALAATLAGLRGQVTLSYPGWHPGEARRTDPAAPVLQAFRVREGDPTLDYDRLRQALGRLRGPVPRGSASVDGTDVWLAALRGGEVPVDGTLQVREAFAALGAGLRAREGLAAAEPLPYHGLVPAEPERWDPRRNPAVIVSASRLETLGRCPHAYMIKYVLRVRVPDSPVAEDRWLEASHRGTLLHDVFDDTLTRARDEGIAATDPRLLELALDALEAAAGEVRAERSPPSEMAYLREMADMRRDLRVWIASLDEPGVEWVECEMEFGPGKDHPPVPVQLPGGVLLTLGAIDRVDRLPGGALRVVDYKTGSPAKYAAKSGVFDGGRRLQHFVYTRAAEALLGAPVDRMEYHFPTERGENGRRGFAREELEAGAEVLDGLLDMVARGHFLPTEDRDDCRYCDYRSVCRVQTDKHGSVSASPLADWAAERAEHLEHYGPLLQARGFAG